MQVKNIIFFCPLLTRSDSAFAYKNNVNSENKSGGELPPNKPSPIMLLDEINKLYQELFELDENKLGISREDIMGITAPIRKDAPLDFAIINRRERVMAMIMQLTHEYLRITGQKV